MLGLWVRNKRNGKKNVMQTIEEENLNNGDVNSLGQILAVTPTLSLRQSNTQVRTHYSQLPLTFSQSDLLVQRQPDSQMLQRAMNKVKLGKNSEKSPRSNKSTINTLSQQASTSTRSKYTNSQRQHSIQEVDHQSNGKGKRASYNQSHDDEEEKIHRNFKRQASSFKQPTTSSIATSIKTNTTNNDEVENGSSDSKQKYLNNEDIPVLTSAQLMNDSSSSYQVGLNIFDELTSKYNRELKHQLKKCILTNKLSMSFDDIAGNEYAKEIINETFVLPSIMPQVFKGKARPWQSILLYGPPGVGKTMLAQAVCYHSKATCFWVSLADITSKFIGESEKLLQMLFDLAREHSPSIILIDEMDSLGRKRTGKESETERRIKTEFLKQMDNIKNLPEKVSVFATTNMPWELDIAALRRFERKILVPMPDKETRKKVMKLHSGTHHSLVDEDFEYLAEHTEGHSGSDLSTLINDALMRPIKQLQLATHFRRVEKRQLVDQLKHEYEDFFGEEGEEDLSGSVWMPVIIEKSQDKDEVISKDPTIKEMDLAAISEKEVFVRKANINDFKKSIDNCKPTVHISFLELYAKFLEKYGHSDQMQYVEELRKLQQPQYLSYYA